METERANYTDAWIGQLPKFTDLGPPEKRRRVMNFIQRAYFHKTTFIPTLDELPMLTRVNSINALFRNAQALGISLETLETQRLYSQFNMIGPDLPETDESTALSLPHQLRPTALQKAVVHGPFIDLLPIAEMRDNILRGIQAGLIDQHELCDKLFCDDLAGFDLDTTSSVVVWGDPWDARNWEFSPDFLMKWRPLLRGCPEVVMYTNSWREKRGEGQVIMSLN